MASAKATKATPPPITFYHPNYPKLKGEVGEAAVNGQLVQYPKVVRSNVDPPLTGQQIGNVSFMFFSQPRILSSGKPVYGFFKLRGNYHNEAEARRGAATIIKEVDSKYTIYQPTVGEWVPLTEETAFIGNQHDVNADSGTSEVHLRDEVAKEKEAEQRRIMRELNENAEKLKSENDDIYSDVESLRYYTMKRTTFSKLRESLEIERRKLKDLEDKFDITLRGLRALDAKHPNYDAEWLDCYNAELAKVGIPTFIPSEEVLEAYRVAVCYTALTPPSSTEGAAL